MGEEVRDEVAWVLLGLSLMGFSANGLNVVKLKWVKSAVASAERDTEESENNIVMSVYDNIMVYI
ncbi:transmembrane protein, putative [Medicago truncatula]|uniref:Transmembrane protein, putative n=1 Tax=Medicago truncatula TaxID=3880 RepID=A0A072V7F2_MEDTR|nr:transmembrane protein, putative [Medicago truncatula]